MCEVNDLGNDARSSTARTVLAPVSPLSPFAALEPEPFSFCRLELFLIMEPPIPAVRSIPTGFKVVVVVSQLTSPWWRCFVLALPPPRVFSSTKEYSQFRRLWDDSGSLTRLNNARVMSSCCAAVAREGAGGSGGATVVGAPLPLGAEGKVELQGGAAPGGAGSGTVAAANASANPNTTTTTCWGQALRSEWASPSETIIDAVAASSIPVVGANQATVVAAAPSEGHEGGQRHGEDGEKEEGETAVSEGAWGAQRRAEGADGEAGATSTPTRGVTFSSQAAAVEAAAGKAEVSRERGGAADKQERGCAAVVVPSTRTEADAVAGSDGGPAETDVVRWGRMDLLSALYPPPVAGEGA